MHPLFMCVNPKCVCYKWVGLVEELITHKSVFNVQSICIVTNHNEVSNLLSNYVI